MRFAGRDKDKNILWDVVCTCGREYISLGQTITRTNKCRWCAHKKPRPYRRKRPFEAMYNIFVGRARYPVSLTYEQFAELAQQHECHYCGAEIIWQEYRRSSKRGGNGSNLDRKDNSGPYSLNNVVVCCGRCNYAKGSHFTYDEWVQIGNLIRRWQNKSVYTLTPFTRRHPALLERELEAYNKEK